MTGILVAGSKPLLSRITIGSLQDLRYVVDCSKADPYTISNMAATCTCNRRDRSLRNMLHGQTFQFQQLREAAMDFGHSLDRLRSDGTSIYVGDQVVSVLIRDGDEIYGAIVRKEALLE